MKMVRSHPWDGPSNMIGEIGCIVADSREE
jgi:hypothetical protein